MKQIQAVLAFLLLPLALSAQNISYEVAFPEPHTHFIEMEMKIDGLKKKEYVDVSIPVWAPGSYLIREFSRSIEGVEAKAGKKKLSVEKLDKNTWRIDLDGAKALNVSYRVHAFEHTVRTSFVDADHAYLNGTSIYMYAHGMKDRPITVTFAPHKSWKVISTTLPKKNGSEWVRTAPNYDLLADSPVEIGNHTIREFKAAGVPHRVALYGRSNADLDKLIDGMKKVVEATTSVFGTNPCKEYLFIIHFTNGKRGGLEHYNSTTCFADRHQYTSLEGYERTWNLVAHEYFHLWNVKRLRPKVLGPFDYENENYTRMLWVVEGFTSYFDEKIMRMAGLYSPERYLGKIANNIDRAENNPGKEIQPVSEASFDAWVKYYRQDEISPNSFVSYYTRGTVLAGMLDLLIIQNSGGKKDLGDFMKHAYQKFYEEGKPGYTDEEFKRELEKFTGSSLDDFYRDYVNGTKQIDFDSFLSHAGLELKVEPSKRPSLGIRIKTEEGKLIITRVRRGSAGWDAGLNVDDEVIGLDDWRIDNEDDLSHYLSDKENGDAATVHISRSGNLRDIKLILKPDGTSDYVTSQKSSPTDKQMDVLRKWLLIKK